MLKIDVDFDKIHHVKVEHKIVDQDTLANELANAIDLIISDIVLSKNDLSVQENIDRAEMYRQELLNKIGAFDFTCLEAYTERELIKYCK